MCTECGESAQTRGIWLRLRGIAEGNKKKRYLGPALKDIRDWPGAQLSDRYTRNRDHCAESQRHKGTWCVYSEKCRGWDGCRVGEQKRGRCHAVWASSLHTLPSCPFLSFCAWSKKDFHPPNSYVLHFYHLAFAIRCSVFPDIWDNKQLLKFRKNPGFYWRCFSGLSSSPAFPLPAWSTRDRSYITNLSELRRALPVVSVL